MKTIHILFTQLLFLAPLTFMACGEQESTPEDLSELSFKVYGNCGMCENTIESSVNGINGVESADWDINSKMLTVSYHTETMNADDIKQKVASVGYDTDTHRSKEAIYNELPECCKYDRPQ